MAIDIYCSYRLSYLLDDDRLLAVSKIYDATGRCSSVDMIAVRIGAGDILLSEHRLRRQEFIVGVQPMKSLVGAHPDIILITLDHDVGREL